MSTQPIWITGTGGLIGHCLLQSAPDAPIRPLNRFNLDLTDSDAICKEFAANAPRLVIHCAAISKSPACLAKPELARIVNVDATRILAELSANIPFVFFSTDLVFDGKKGSYVEDDPVNPLNLYAETKAAAEEIILSNPAHTVIRTSLNGGASPTGDRGFNEEMKQAWRQGRTLNLFTDEFRCPIAAHVTARVIWALIEANRPGLYHLAGSERLSRWEIGQLLAARHPELNPKITPGSLRNYQGARRAPDTSLDCSRIQSILPFPLPRFSDWLQSDTSDF